MPRPASDPARGMPRWLIFLGSLAIAFHFLAVVCGALAAPSGPWPTMEGSNLATPPQFAFSLDYLTRPYLKLVKMTHNYHFATNRPGMPGSYFEARLKDESGRELATIQIPDANANFWVRHRQALLAQGLADDQPVQPPPGEVIAAPNQALPNVPIWDAVENRRLKIRTVPEHLIPRDRPVFRPSDWSLVLARSYGRYLCRAHGAASVEIIRHTQESIPPVVLSLDNVQAGAFDELISNFGEISR
jgi:hypothetical protein